MYFVADLVTKILKYVNYGIHVSGSAIGWTDYPWSHGRIPYIV